jgi:hypothetical protein
MSASPTKVLTDKQQVYTLWLMSQAYDVRPSRLLELDRPLVALDFDMKVMAWGGHVDNALGAVKREQRQARFQQLMGTSPTAGKIQDIRSLQAVFGAAMGPAGRRE